jgi:hypothetical protein
VTPVPLELPLRPSEAAELANLIFDHAEGKPLTRTCTGDVRNRLAARAGGLKFQTLAPFFGSLERDPVHPSAYYLAVDGEASPQLLYIALSSAPTSSIFYQPLLIGRMRRHNGPEFVINAIPFGPADRESVERFAARTNSAFYPQPQGARATITVEQDYPAAFHTFGAIERRTGRNLAAVSGDYHAALWAAIRAGWRSGYTAAIDLAADRGAEALKSLAGFSRYALTIAPTEAGVKAAEEIHQQIRQARAAMKIARAFDFEWDAASPMTPRFLRTALERMKDSGHAPQLVCPGFDAGANRGRADDEELEELAAVARQFQVTLSFRYGGEPGERVQAVARATAGRLNYRVPNASAAEFVAEHLL